MTAQIINSPVTIDELMLRVEALAGLNLGAIAANREFAVPENLLHHKGWVGQLLENVLGTDAGNTAAPDFTKLQIELKTIPVDSKGKPQESTYVSVVPLLGAPGLTWQTSEIRAKLCHVLWIPIEADTNKPIAARRVGRGILWRMPPHIDAIFEADWQELMEMVLLGQLSQINARIGQYLHIRPKAANSKSLTYGLGSDGCKIATMPRGFYLRTQLTAQILSKKC